MALPVLFLPVLSTPFFKLQAQRWFYQSLDYQRNAPNKEENKRDTASC
jgi:hypothetical protein